MISAIELEHLKSKQKALDDFLNESGIYDKTILVLNEDRRNLIQTIEEMLMVVKTYAVYTDEGKTAKEFLSKWEEGEN